MAGTWRQLPDNGTRDIGLAYQRCVRWGKSQARHKPQFVGCVFLALEPIMDEHRRTERQLWREFETMRPRILGALLDAAAHGLQRLARVRFERAPRMADFALWATACQ